MCRTRIAHGDGVDGGAAQNHAKLCEANAEHFLQSAEFLLLRNRGLGPLAVTVLPIMALDLTITLTDEMSIDGHISKAVTARANILTGAVKLEL